MYSSLKEKSVLYVEDELDVLKNIATLLSGFFKNFYTAADGVEALSIFDSHPIDLLLVDALKNITFEKKVGYLFMQNMQGVALIHPNPQLEGSNTLNLRDVNGKYIIKEFMRVLEEDNEGFVDYYWHIPGKEKNKMYYKITFVKKLDMYDWYIGAGEYLRYMTQFVSQEMLSYIKEGSERVNFIMFP